jgi:VanZ family protein
VLLVILRLGLWPMRTPRNTVHWLGDRPGLEFRKFSTAITFDSFAVRDSGTLEIWLKPERAFDRHTLLGFTTREHPYRLLMLQSESALEIQTESGGHWFPKMSTVRVEDVFRGAPPVLFTLTTEAQKGLVYVNGVLSQTSPAPFWFDGQMVVGSSPGQQNSWRGQIYGLAVYGRQLTAAEVARHYLLWKERDTAEIVDGANPVALYFFDERGGQTVHNHSGAHFDLSLPIDYTVVNQFFLEPVWREFSSSPTYWGDIFKNVIGFVPLGFCLYPLLLSFGVRRAVLLSVAAGAGVSIGMELIQAMMPARDSGTTDILSNTLGTWIGIAYYIIARRVAMTILSRRQPVRITAAAASRSQPISVRPE